jgi:hypothetical protein
MLLPVPPVLLFPIITESSVFRNRPAGSAASGDLFTGLNGEDGNKTVFIRFVLWYDNRNGGIRLGRIFNNQREINGGGNPDEKN